MAYIKINRDNFFYNLNQIVLKTGSIDRVAVVLKDNAYGHGLETIAKLSSEFGIKRAVVINRVEAESIKEYFEHILILDDAPVEDSKFSFVIGDLAKLAKVDNRARIELKVDTGMHRNGIGMDQLSDALDMINDKGIDLVGVMTHFRSADIMSSEFYWQYKNFQKVKKEVVYRVTKKLHFHSNNSAAMLRSSNSEDFARVGIAIYGHNELPDIYDRVELRPVLSLWAKRVSSRVLKQGQRVGYGGDFTASRDMMVSTYDLGYGDGWIRGDHTQPYITADGLPVLGRVSMDFVTLESDREEICIMADAKRAAKHFGTISYEMTTMLSKSIVREVE